MRVARALDFAADHVGDALLAFFTLVVLAGVIASLLALIAAL